MLNTKQREIRFNRIMNGLFLLLIVLIASFLWYDTQVATPAYALKAKINFENKTKELNQLRVETFANGGEVVGKLNDGRVVTLYVVKTTSFPHHVYVVDKASSVSTNKTIQTGKNSFENQVDVVAESEE